jgi:hypothetical protein
VAGHTTEGLGGGGASAAGGKAVVVGVETGFQRCGGVLAAMDCQFMDMTVFP